MTSQQSYFRRAFAWALLWVLMGGCIDPFEPDIDEVETNFVVVDGFINSRGVSTIKLSRTFKLSTEGQPPAETRARVLIEQEGGSSVTLTESAPGTYTSAPLNLGAGTRYRLHFYTSNGKEYASAYTPVKITPAIDTVEWRLGGQGVQISVSTQDATNQSRYYRWGLEETWEFTSAHRSILEFVNGRMQTRQEDIYRCWANSVGSNIRLFNTTPLSQDVVSRQQLLEIPRTDTRLRLKYSVLVKQYAQTPEEYAYWDELRKNTESIGTLFDPLPSQVTGNVRCLSDASETVLGFVGAYSVAEKRIFISHEALPNEWRIYYKTGYENCMLLDTFLVRDADAAFSNPAVQPVEPVYNDRGILIAYTASARKCIDCRERGVNKRPSFWR
ncbi:DUF4249 domain-containing protein [Solirubrum puertoriconensis]|uniref:DUF4249 domain-containing protein n=1 Tax=Solirubrum puertoriconensis TaxID=1751427 RepID=A0A9X0HJC6_SOLP1|nr:DUF4249 domain-containing protein [Solirubrum puertoriconensis]KUG06988.1 hypothetical protein ASU33_06615 [Solirubrum puertoriconensis]